MISKIISPIILLFMVSIILTTPVAAHQTSVSVNAPESVDGDFSVVIEIKNAVDLDSGQFDLYFDSGAVNVTGVDDGNIDGTTIPVDGWALMGEHTIRVLFNIPGIDGVSGSGSLATIHFETIVPGDCAMMELSNGLLIDTMAEEIPANWNGVESAVSKTATKSETPGFGAVFAIGLLAAAIFASRRG